MIRIDDIIEKFTEHHPDGDPTLIQKAYVFASMMHEYQKRKSGLPYIVHPLNVAYTIAEIRLDEESIVAALLHDVVEDTETPIDKIEELFGKEVALLVDGLTKLSALENLEKSERQAANFKKLLIAMAEDPRVLIIKLADRLDNMRTLEFMKEHKQKTIAEETLDIYAPLAHAIGMGKIKGELENLSFKYIAPDEYKSLSEKVEERKTKYEPYVDEIYNTLKEEMLKNGINCIIQKRFKHVYSIYKKMKQRNITLDEVYDFLAFRIILKNNDPNECYKVIGILHGLWVYVAHRWRDFISQPKKNGYQSLHTTLIYGEGLHFEVQVRTEEMHRIAEEGLAAHWQYKQGKLSALEDSRIYQLLSKTIVELQENSSSSRFINDMKMGLKDISNDIMVLTPRGKTITLPHQSTPVDFAYAIHTEVGHKCVRAKVDGKIVPLDTELKDGNLVEIHTLPSATPSRDWLKFVKTNRAKNRIRAWFRNFEKERNLSRGKELLEKALRKHKIPFSDVDIEKINKEIKSHPITKIDDLYILIGGNAISLRKVLGIIKPSLAAKKKAAIKRGNSKDSDFEKKVRIKGIDHIYVTRARCCNPIYGDDIIGYLTKVKGVSIHRVDCENLKQTRIDPARFIDVEWVETEKMSFTVDLNILTEDVKGILTKLTDVFDKMNLDLRKVIGETHKAKQQAIFRFIVQVDSRQQLDNLIVKLKSIKGVLSVWRKK